MDRKPLKIPRLSRHKASGRGVVCLNGRDHYLGKFGTQECQDAYDRLIAEWIANGRQSSRAKSEMSILELIDSYLVHARSYYVKDGKTTSEYMLIKLSFRPLNRIYGKSAAKDFGPAALKVVRNEFIASGLCRNEVNRRTGHVVRLFRWACEEEMVPSSVHHGLKAVAGLRRGRTEVRESIPVRPVADELVDAIKPHVSRTIWAMIELQRLTGMRPGEVVAMRTMDIDRSGDTWVYTPESHKTEHHGRSRSIYLGPRAQEVATPWLRADPLAYLFDPREVVAEQAAEARARRKTPVQASRVNRVPGPSPKRPIRSKYSVSVYAVAIDRACDRSFPHPVLSQLPERSLTVEQTEELKAWRVSNRWSPNQLRHLAATRLRREAGLEVAKAVLGHSSITPTQVYAERDQDSAREAMSRLG